MAPAKKKPTASVRRSAATVGTKPELKYDLQRDCEFDIDRASLDVTKRSVDVSFSSETKSVTFFGTPQILVHERKSMVLTNLKRGSVLFHHDPTNIVGRVSNVRLDEDRIGRATIIFDDDDQGNHAMRKVQSGSLRGISVGAKVQTWARLENNEEWKSPEGRTFRGPADLAVKWTPIEISLTPTPADDAVGVGRADGLEHETMNKKLREFLVTRGMNKDATDDEAMKFFEELDLVSRKEVDDLVAAAAVKSAKKSKTKVVRSEPEGDPEPEPALTKSELERTLSADRDRVATIRDVCRTYPETESLEAEFVRTGTSLDAVRAKCWDVMAKARPAISAGEHRVEYGNDARDKFSRAAELHLLMRTDKLSEKDDADDLKIAREVDAYNMMDLVRATMTSAGINFKGLSRDQMIARAISHSSSDYPLILENVANKVLQAAYEEAPSTWEAFCKTVSASDFKSMARYKLGDAGDLIETPEGAPMSEGTVPEGKESYAIATYSRRFGITRQAIINDDMNALTSIPEKMGAAARRLPNKLFYDELISGTSNKGPFMAEGGGSLQLFAAHASGDNDITGALTAAAGVASLAAAKAVLRLITGFADTNETAPTLNLVPAVLLVSAAKEDVALQLVSNITPATIANVRPDWIRQLQVVVEPRLDAIEAGVPWYLKSNGVDGAEMAFLSGQRTPSLIRQEGTNVLGVEWGLYFDVGTKFTEHRGWIRSTGV